MPDKWRFDQLGERVRCVDCNEGGFVYEWPERRRVRHAQAHDRQSARELEVQRRQSAANARRLKALADRENRKLKERGI